LQDIATTTWRAVDLKAKKWALTTIKTHQQKVLPLADPLLKYLNSLKSKRDPKSAVFPTLAASVKKTDRVGHVSNEFHDLLVKAKFLAPRSKRSTGKGRSARRQQNELSFHCLRHTNNSLLKKAGVPESVVMAFVGHESPEISRQYTHVEEESLAKAVKSLPDISA
jgi:integrase